MRASSVGLQPEFEGAAVSEVEVEAEDASLTGGGMEVSAVCWVWVGSSVGELSAIF